MFIANQKCMNVINKPDLVKCLVNIWKDKNPGVKPRCGLMKWRQHLEDNILEFVCAQAGFVIHHPCPIMVHSYRQVVWMVMSVFQSKLWRNQSMCIRCSWNHEDDKKAKGLIVTTLTPNKQLTYVTLDLNPQRKQQAKTLRCGSWRNHMAMNALWELQMCCLSSK